MKKSSEFQKDLYIAFLQARVQIGELFSGFLTQAIKPDEITGHLTEILKDLSDRVIELCDIIDVSK